jgi:hypothetical protein
LGNVKLIPKQWQQEILWDFEFGLLEFVWDLFFGAWNFYNLPKTGNLL